MNDLSDRLDSILHSIGEEIYWEGFSREEKWVQEQRRLILQAFKDELPEGKDTATTLDVAPTTHSFNRGYNQAIRDIKDRLEKKL